jgi:hypothetical protein
MGLDALIAVQYGVARREQLVRAGISPDTLRQRVDSGEWQCLFPTVYALSAVPLDARRRQVAAWLYAGPGAQLAGPTAARLYGLRTAPDDPDVHLLVPHGRKIHSAAFAVIHRTARPDAQPQRIEPIAVCSVARALADTARWCPDKDGLAVLLSEALERRFTTVEALREELDTGPRNGSSLLRTALDNLTRGACSAPGRDLRVTLTQSRILPEIIWNPQLVAHDGQPLPWVDGWLDEGAIGLEIDPGGGTPDDWEQTMRRHAKLADYGILMLHFPPDRLRRDAMGVRATVERTWQQRRASGARAAVTVVRAGRRPASP